jgi:hypothetical protein
MFEVPKVYFATERATDPEQRILIQSGVFEAIAAASQSTFIDVMQRLGVPHDKMRHLPSALMRQRTSEKMVSKSTMW